MGWARFRGHSKTLLRAVKHGFCVLPGRGQPSSESRLPFDFERAVARLTVYPGLFFGFVATSRQWKSRRPHFDQIVTHKSTGPLLRRQTPVGCRPNPSEGGRLSQPRILPASAGADCVRWPSISWWGPPRCVSRADDQKLVSGDRYEFAGWISARLTIRRRVSVKTASRRNANLSRSPALVFSRGRTCCHAAVRGRRPGSVLLSPLTGRLERACVGVPFSLDPTC
jgi:hypothetical protein